jgi:hypothetical protein
VPDAFPITQLSLTFLRNSSLTNAFNVIAAERLTLALSAGDNVPSMSANL